LDEVQLVEDFVEALLSLMHNPQLEVYVSGSNSRGIKRDDKSKSH
jgi:predicted AAA+ superfamily ATPase